MFTAVTQAVSTGEKTNTEPRFRIEQRTTAPWSIVIGITLPLMGIVPLNHPGRMPRGGCGRVRGMELWGIPWGK